MEDSTPLSTALASDEGGDPGAWDRRGLRRRDSDAQLYATIQRRRRVVRIATRWAYACVATVLVAVVLPGSIYWLASRDAALQTFLLPISLVFTFVAVPISVWGIVQHVTNYWQPVLQRYVVRILWMVPVYSVTSVVELALWLEVEGGSRRAELWVTTPSVIRACYEAYTVLNFMYFLVTFLEVHYDEAADKVIATLADDDNDDDERHAETGSSFSEEGTGGGLGGRRRPEVVRHPCPPYSCCILPWRVDNGDFLRCCQFGVTLYTTVMPLCALVELLDSFFGPDDPDDRHSAGALLESPSAWAGAVQFNLSNHAIYCLGLFFYTTHEILAPCQPHAKFVAVKGIVFGTFFQNLGIDAVFFLNPSLAASFGDTSKTSRAAVGALKCTLLSVEMLGFALLHASAFPHRAFPRVYRPGDEPDESPSTGASGQGPDPFAPRTDADDDGPFTPRKRASTEWQAAWGDYYASQRRARRLWRARGRVGDRPRDGIDYSHVIFDVSDVHHDTTDTLRRIQHNVAELREQNDLIRRIQRFSRRSILRRRDSLARSASASSMASLPSTIPPPPPPPRAPPNDDAASTLSPLAAPTQTDV